MPISQYSYIWILVFGLLSAGFVPASFAQRVDKKAILSAENAFGSSVEGKSIGIYNSGFVRGFSPSSAGNLRIEGLYFDRVTSLSGRVTSGYTVRVGSNAVGYAFPAPTGIVDIRLRDPQNKKLTSALLHYGSYGGSAVEFDHQSNSKVYPSLSLSTGLGVYEHHFGYGGKRQIISFGMLGQWKTSPSYGLKGFLSLRRSQNETAPPSYITEGNYIPPKVKRRVYDGFPWTKSSGDQYNMGLITHALIVKTRINLGIFFSKSQSGKSYHNLVTDIQPNGLADRLIFAYPSSNYQSISGELQFIRSFNWKDYQHNLIASLRYREAKSKYAGSDSIRIRNTWIGQTPKLKKPSFTFSERNRDKIKQTMIGVGYEFKKQDQYSLNIGIQKINYQKTSYKALSLSSLLQESQPILPYISLKNQFTRSISSYISYTKGLEESPGPPSNAINRFDTFPAIETRQYELGFVWTPNRKHTLTLGYFDIKKPYLTLNKNNYFGSIGNQISKGVEFSLKTELMEKLTLLIGGVVSDPRVKTNQNIKYQIGKRPVGANNIYGQINLYYEFGFLPGLSVDLSLNYNGKEPVNPTNQFYVDPTFRTGLSAHYQFKLAQHKASLEFSLSNPTNEYRYVSRGYNSFQPLYPRLFSINFITDL